MKVCYSNPTMLMKRPIAEIANAINSKNIQTSILIPRKINEGRDVKSHYANLKVKVIDYPALRSPLQWEFPIPLFSFFTKSWKMLKENDVVHLWVPFYLHQAFICFFKMLFFRDKKLILTMDTIPAYSFSMGAVANTLLKISYRTFAKIIFAAADEITLYGESMIPYAKKAGLPMNKVKITPTGVNPSAKKKTKDIRKEFGIGKKERVVLFIGLLVPRKGVDTVIKAAAELPDYKFLLVGDGPFRSKYESMINKLGLSNVVVVGYRSDIHNFYQCADTFFLPSRGEGIPGVVLEAMTYGVPVVSSKIPCTQDIINSKTGLLCSTENVDCYVAALKKLEKMSFRSKIIKAAKEKVKKDFLWARNIKRFKELYVWNSGT